MVDFGVLLISFSKGKEMDIEFYSTEFITKNTKVILLHHSFYNNDYVLSNINVGEKNYLTIEELYDLSPIHNKWIEKNTSLLDDEVAKKKKDEKRAFHRKKKKHHLDKAKYHEEKENE